jgi:hypothetical protein
MGTRKKVQASDPATEVAPENPPEAEPADDATTDGPRDPRLPPRGTPMTKTWRGHAVAIVEFASGFEARVDGKVVAEDAKSLSAACRAVLATEGVEGTCNGFQWMGLASRPSAPREARSHDPLAALRSDVARAEARFMKATAEAADAESALARARRILDAVENALAADSTP